MDRLELDENEAIEQCPIGMTVNWSDRGLGIGPSAFDALYGRLEKLEAIGKIEIVHHRCERHTGHRYFTRVGFRRLL